MLVRELGPVFGPGELMAAACLAGLPAVRIVRLAAELESLGLIDRPHRDVWVAPCTLGAGERALASAQATVRVAGSWAVAAGAWALRLRDAIPPSSSSFVRGIAFCHAIRATSIPHRSGIQSRRSLAARMHGKLPPAAIARRVIVVDDRPVAVVTRPWGRLGHGSWLGSEVIGVPTLDVEDAIVSMFASMRIAGGFDAARETFGDAVPHSDERSLRRAVRDSRLSVRRRVAHAMRELGYDHAVPGIPRGRADIEWFCDIGSRRGTTVLEPHRVAEGVRVRATGILDNRGQPLRPALVATSPDPPYAEPECWHPDTLTEFPAFMEGNSATAGVAGWTARGAGST